MPSFRLPSGLAPAARLVAALGLAAGPAAAAPPAPGAAHSIAATARASARVVEPLRIALPSGPLRGGPAILPGGVAASLQPAPSRASAAPLFLVVLN